MHLMGIILFLTFSVKNDIAETTSVLGYKRSTDNPGYPKNISTNDPNVKAAARVTVYAYNNMSNDLFLFKVLEIKKAMIQIVKGIKYMLQTKIGRTICTKRQTTNPDKCDFQKENLLKKVLDCYSEVWNITWIHEVTVLVLKCKDIPVVPLKNETKEYLFYSPEAI
ncbi:cystatin-F [Spea bombifrons]|uniref:cystatin-F n=1 Tax=Spea bombifrons TaxID=233779 RepID=UPI00234B0F54|nr:cystatin-F [Spea bombifrons]